MTKLKKMQFSKCGFSRILDFEPKIFGFCHEKIALSLKIDEQTIAKTFYDVSEFISGVFNFEIKKKILHLKLCGDL